MYVCMFINYIYIIGLAGLVIQFHIITREMGYLALTMLKYHIPYWIVDPALVMLSKVVYGDIAKYYGVKRPKEGPFTAKIKDGKYPIFDVGTHAKVKSGQIQVYYSHFIIIF